MIDWQFIYQYLTSLAIVARKIAYPRFQHNRVRESKRLFFARTKHYVKWKRNREIKEKIRKDPFWGLFKSNQLFSNVF